MSNDVEYRFSNRIKQTIDLIKPKDLYVYGGRGLAKTTDILASRSVDIVYDMPRGAFIFTASTYVDLLTNIIPNICVGWESRCDFYEGTHFVVDKEPPSHWDRPYYQKTYSHKHTITTFNGCKFYMTSLDRPISNGGLSVVHVLGDEAKSFKESKLNEVFPTLRGDPKLFSHSPYFLGKTFCSDMPDLLKGEEDWMSRMFDNMDREQILKCLQVGVVINDIKREIYIAETKGEDPIMLKKELLLWEKRHNKVRRGSVLFYRVSSFANADVLGYDYFENALKTLPYEKFKLAICSIKGQLSPGERFYNNLVDKHFYSDGYNYDGYYDKYGLMDNVKVRSAGLRYINTNAPLEAGFDAGNMMSLIIGQQSGDTYRILKNFYTLPPQWIRELADKFLDYFDYHNYKVIRIYYDRAANQYRKAKQDIASKLKDAIEKKTDPFTGKLVSTGWKVELMSIAQATISHLQEYDFMNIVLGETDNKLPKIRIDKNECKELKSSLELARAEKDHNGNLRKNKKSEKLPMERLPMESTNFSDAFKYLLCRREWLNMAINRNMAAHDYIPKVY